jgi:hypothetical protein
MTNVEKAKKTPAINPVLSAAARVEAQTSCLMPAAVMKGVPSRFGQIFQHFHSLYGRMGGIVFGITATVQFRALTHDSGHSFLGQRPLH